MLKHSCDDFSPYEKKKQISSYLHSTLIQIDQAVLI